MQRTPPSSPTSTQRKRQMVSTISPENFSDKKNRPNNQQVDQVLVDAVVNFNPDEFGGGKKSRKIRRNSKTRGGKRQVNKSLKAWVAFVKKVQKEEKLSYKDAIHRAKQRKDKGEKWMKGGVAPNDDNQVSNNQVSNDQDFNYEDPRNNWDLNYSRGPTPDPQPRTDNQSNNYNSDSDSDDINSLDYDSQGGKSKKKTRTRSRTRTRSKGRN
jgi:hypothetical protein